MNERAWEKLAAADRLLLYDLHDQAEATYAELLAEVPTSSEAMFGLARVALERGDEQLAHERVAAAVRLNPRNDDAQRLLSRLTEILAARQSSPAQQRPAAVRPSEQSAFARNRSMADHRAEERNRADDKRSGG